ncbi:MAG: nicotinate phosphoribosyltransferase, partial [Alphaproteobacteria bacterium]|nr:nicotinate phosphoribosyltransferase [Alphaproteobacteria bacterium]
FGTTQFLANAPRWVGEWTGARPDSKDPFEAGEELIAFWSRIGLSDEEIAANRLIIFADGLDVALEGREPNGKDIALIHRHFAGRVGVGFGWGTNLTNDFIGAEQGDPDLLRSLSLVCKIVSVNGHATVKLSDNPAKANGPPDEVAIYREAFGSDGMNEVPVRV